MKKLHICLLSGLILGAIMAFTHSMNTVTHGSITYDIQLSGSRENPQVQQMIDGSTMKFYWKPNASRTDLTMSMMSVSSILKGDKALMLMDGMGRKNAVKLSRKELKEANNQNKVEISVKKTDKTKTIKGYPCKKAIITTTSPSGQTIELDYWYTDKIQASKATMRQSYKNIEGFPLSMEANSQGFVMKFIAKEINTDKPSPKLFDLSIPEGYEEKSLEELRQMRGY